LFCFASYYKVLLLGSYPHHSLTSRSYRYFSLFQSLSKREWRVVSPPLMQVVLLPILLAKPPNLLSPSLTQVLPPEFVVSPPGKESCPPSSLFPTRPSFEPYLLPQGYSVVLEVNGSYLRFVSRQNIVSLLRATYFPTGLPYSLVIPDRLSSFPTVSNCRARVRNYLYLNKSRDRCSSTLQHYTDGYCVPFDRSFVI